MAYFTPTLAGRRMLHKLLNKVVEKVEYLKITVWHWMCQKRYWCGIPNISEEIRPRIKVERSRAEPVVYDAMSLLRMHMLIMYSTH